MPVFERHKEECIVRKEVPQPDTAAVYNTPNVITSIEGTQWALIYYYSQILGDSDEPKQIDFGLSPALQQYYKISNVSLYVTTELDSSTDTNILTELKGTANMYPGLVPNIGDHFIATMGDGQVGVFVVTQVTRLSYYKQSAHQIDYEFFDYYSQDFIDQFELKTVEEKRFENGGLLSASQASAQSTEAPLMLAQLVDIFYDDFFDNLTRTALYPTEAGRTYDPGTVKFFKAIVDRDMRQSRPMVQVYETPAGAPNLRYTTIWDVILDGSLFGLIRASEQYREVSARSFGSNNVGYSIATSPISKVLYPSSVEGLRFGKSVNPDDSYYIFNKAFYENDLVNMTKLEKLVRKKLECQEVTMEEIRAQANHVMEYVDDNKRFWHIPVLIWLLTRAINGK